MSAYLETPHLRLRRLVPSDEPDLIALDSDPDVMRYVGSPAGVRLPGETAERARQRILESLRGDHGPLGFWRIEGRDDGAFFGLDALLRMPGSDEVEAAYRLARAAWGRGIATEATGALVRHAPTAARPSREDVLWITRSPSRLFARNGTPGDRSCQRHAQKIGRRYRKAFV